MPQNSEVPGTYLYGSGCFFKKTAYGLREEGVPGTYLLVVVLLLVLLALVLLVVLVVAAAVMSLPSEHCILKEGRAPRSPHPGV